MSALDRVFNHADYLDRCGRQTLADSIRDVAEVVRELAEGACTYRFHDGDTDELDSACPGVVCVAKTAVR